MKRLHLIPILMAVIIGACSAKKATTAQNMLQFDHVSAYLQKVYPGVSGEVIYFLEYRIQMDVQTTVEVQFEKLVIGETEVPIHSVKVGNKILNTNLGEHLSENAKNVNLNGSLPIYHKDRNEDSVDELANPQKIMLHYKAKGETDRLEITDLHFEPNQYRPAAHPGQRE